MIDSIYKLEKLIQKKHLSRQSNKRLVRDLEAIYQRLEKDEYKTSGITENAFDVPDKTQQLFKLLETYSKIAKTWSKVLEKIAIHSIGEIVDICPGFAPKIEIALCRLNYRGKVIILDENLDSIRHLTKATNIFNPQFKIISYSHDVFKPIRKKFSFVIGNHIIDDLVLNYYTKKYGEPRESIYEKEDKLISMWNKILKNEQDNFIEITEKLTKIFITMIKKGGYLCLSQYKSYLENMLNLDKSYNFSQKIFFQLRLNLLANGFTKVNNSKNEFRISILKNG